MQEVLTRLLDAEKEGDRIVSEARIRASAMKSETDTRCAVQLKAERERLRKRMDSELSALAAREEKLFQDEVASLENKKLLLDTGAGKNKTTILEKLKEILCSTDIG